MRVLNFVLSLVRRRSTRCEAETIFALSSGRGVCGVAVIRVSGPEAIPAVETLTRVPEPRVARLRKLRHKGELLDEAMVVRFDGPKSFTGEDVVELHCHGGVATVEGVLEALSEVARPAEPGEFTRRAFDKGKLSLTEVEGLADLLVASTSRQRQQALGVMGGALDAKYQEWRDHIKTTRAMVEAAVDFGDDVEGDVNTQEALSPVRDRVVHLRSQLERGLSGRAEAVRDGIRVVLAGPPNAGKSSLVNALAMRPAAIVSEVAGTTRDVLEVRLRLKGYEVVLYDTAGLRDSNDSIEVEGIRRAREACDNAHLVAYVVDSTRVVVPDVKADFVVMNKADLDDGSGLDEVLKLQLPVVSTCSLTEDGVDSLIEELERRVEALFLQEEDDLAVVRLRHRRHVEASMACLDAALDNIDVPELLAEDLRTASNELGRVVGAIDVEDVLDALFRDFCVGK